MPTPQTDRLVLAADATDDQLHADAPTTGVVEAADAPARTIAGIVLPWEAKGNTSAGSLRFSPQSIRLPKDLTRVKLVRDHTGDANGGVPVGVATAFENRPEGLHMTFSVAATPDGDRALVEASERVRDSFSIEAAQLTRQGPDVTDSVLKAVALVPFPAYAAAQVETVTAADAGDGAADAGAAGPGSGAETIRPADTENAATSTDAPGTTSTDPTDDPTDSEETDPVKTSTLRPAVVPSGLGATTTEPRVVTASDVIETVVAMRSGRQVDEAHAAFQAITNSANLDAAPPAWLGELWSGVTYQREIVPLLTQAPLTSWKAKGYRWTTKPKVGKYAGDLAEIPSTKPVIEPVEVDAERWAGGNAIDRKFLDFNDAEYLAAYWRAMTESYAEETDGDAGAFIAANATPLGGTAAPDLIRAVTRAAIRIKTSIKTPATFAVINPLDLETILDIAELDAPKFMSLTPISDPSKWTTHEDVEPGTVIVGAKPAVTFYELAGSPIRVEAEAVAKGGRDAALFGYTACLLNRPEGLVKTTFAKVAG